MVTKFKKSKKASWATIIFSVLVGILFLVMVGLLVASNLKINQKRSELKSKLEFLRKEIQTLEKKNRQLKNKISQAGKESYLEKEARERLNLKKPGEKAVTILPLKEKKEIPKPKQKIWWNPFSW